MADEIDSRLLMSTIEKLERMDEEAASSAADKKEILAEAKSAGLDPKIIKKLVSLRKQTAEERESDERYLEVYMRAANM